MSVRKAKPGEKHPEGRPWEMRLWMPPDATHPKTWHSKLWFASSRVAKAKEEETRAHLKEGSYVPGGRDSATVEERMAEYFAGQAVRDNTRRAYRTAMRNQFNGAGHHHLRGTSPGHALARLPWKKATTPDVRAWVAEISGAIAPHMVRQTIGYLRGMYAQAVQDQLVSRNPVPPNRDLSLPTKQGRKVKPLTEGQILDWAYAVPCDEAAAVGVGAFPWERVRKQGTGSCAVCEADITHLRWWALYCGKTCRNAASRAREASLRRGNPGALQVVRRMILVQAGLGLRISELIALRVQDVDFLRHVVHVRVQVQKRKLTGALKTGNSTGTVPLPDSVAVLLQEQIADTPPRKDGVIFRQPNGELWALQTQGKYYKNAARLAGLPEDTSSHDCRHYYASRCLADGATVLEVAEWIRDSPQTVLKTYGHLIPGRENIARDSIDTAFARAREGREVSNVRQLRGSA
jgi:site-specific recombinase XerD